MSIYEKVIKFYVYVKYQTDIQNNNKEIMQTFKFLLTIIDNNNNDDNEINKFYIKYMSKIITPLPEIKNSFETFLDIVYLNINSENNKNFYILLNIKLSNVILDHIYKLR